MAIGPYIRRGERLWVGQVRIKGQQQRGAFLDKANPGVPVAVNAALVPFGLSEPPFEVEVVLRQVPRPRLPQTAPAQSSPSRGPCVAASDRRSVATAPAHLKLLLTLGTRATRRLKRRLDSPDILHVGAQYLVDVMDSRQPAVNVAR